MRFSREYVISTEDAENIVQDIFMYLWNIRYAGFTDKPQRVPVHLTKNRCIDFIAQSINRQQKESLDNLQDRELKLKNGSIDAVRRKHLYRKEIENLLAQAIEHLPEKCRQVFILSRMNGLET